MAVNLAPIFNDAPYMDTSGNPSTGYSLYTYTAGSSTPETTYTTSLGNVQNANPMTLNSAGYPTTSGTQTQIWLTAGVSYKFVLKNASGAEVWSRDNIDGINDTTVTIDQWVAGPAPTYVSATSFTLVGDQTSTFHVGRRLKVTDSGGTKYATITASTFGVLTTVDVAVDASGSLATPTSAVSYALVSAANHSVPGFQTKGDLLTPNSLGTLTRVAVGSNGTVPMARSAATPGIAYVAALNKAIYGLTYDVGTDTTNDININVGGAMDATGAYWMTLSTALGKQSDVAWAVGGTTAAPAGWLDTGAVGNSDYYIWLIARSDTGVVDSLCSLSSTSPTMPAQYDFKRLIGWFKRSGGTIVAFHTYETEGGGLEFNWDSPTLDINLANTLTTTRRTDAVKVPLNFSTEAHLNAAISDATSAAVAWIYCPDQTDLAPSSSVAPLANVSSGTSYTPFLQMKVRTSSTGTIAARASIATVDLYLAVTVGFKWARRN